MLYGGRAGTQNREQATSRGANADRRDNCSHTIVDYGNRTHGASGEQHDQVATD